MEKMQNYGAMCPNPAFRREEYEFLTGEWDFSFSSADEQPVFDRKIVVPYSYECEASGIGDPSMHECVWYERKFDCRKHAGKVLLHFEGVDYRCTVFVNGVEAGEHRGGYTAFVLDITPFVRTGENTLRVRVLDNFRCAQLRGKQRSRKESYDCWYVQTTGIWKPVWLEYGGSNPLRAVDFRPSNSGEVVFTGSADGGERAELSVFFGGEQVAFCSVPVADGVFSGKLQIASVNLWDSAHPNLYDVCVRIPGEPDDVVHTYFAFREVRSDSGGIYVNGERVYLNMILAQGYWDKTMLTAPNESALEADIRLIRRMGFNGIRMHQKVESAVFYYLCDRLGMYVWGEIPSAYEYCDEMKREFSSDCIAIVRQLGVHPCILAWVLFNESWGIPSVKSDRECQQFVESVKDAVRAADPSRLIVINDGWHQLDGDLLTLHEYEQNADMLSREYADKQYVVQDKIVNQNRWGRSFADNYSYAGQSILISEFGGVSLAHDGGWGYGDKAEGLEEYGRRVSGLVTALHGIGYLSGICYTQFTDVQQETNGLVTIDRVPKLPIERIRSIFTYYPEGNHAEKE